jgi:hypothetical protein
MALLRRFAPPPKPASTTRKYDQRQVPEPLPTGVIGAVMCGIGICLLLSFFLFREANHLWAQADGPAELRVYATPVLWGIFPGFAALAVPWPLTLWWLHRQGRHDEADTIAEQSNQGGGFNSHKVLVWASYWLVLPIGMFTVLAIPIHMCLGAGEARVGHYASWHSEVFRFDQARHEAIVDGFDPNGKFHPAKDLVIDFADGRRLRAGQVGDGGEAAKPEVMRVLLEKTKLTPAHEAAGQNTK